MDLKSVHIGSSAKNYEQNFLKCFKIKIVTREFIILILKPKHKTDFKRLIYNRSILDRKSIHYGFKINPLWTEFQSIMDLISIQSGLIFNP